MIPRASLDQPHGSHRTPVAQSPSDRPVEAGPVTP